MLQIRGTLTPEAQQRGLVEEARRMRAAQQKAYIDAATADAAAGRQAPERIDTTMSSTEISWDGDPGWRDRQIKEIRRKRNAGEILKPKQFIEHPDGTLEKPYDECELEAIALGLFCIRCHNPQPDDDREHDRLHQRLADTTDYRVPAGLTNRDCCCYCGGRLDPKPI